MTDRILPQLLGFIVCDDVRREIGDRVTLVGVYNSRKVPVAAVGPGIALTPFNIYMQFQGGSGTFHAKAHVTTPDGKSTARDLGVATFSGEPISIVNLNFPSFPVPQEGEYRVKFDLGEAQFETAFSVAVTEQT